MKVTPNKPSTPPEAGARPPVEWLDKHQAAEYLNISVSTLFYHHYTSPLQLLPKPTKVYGRLMWTKEQLDEFKSKNPTPGFKLREGNPSVTLAEYVADRLDRTDKDYYFKDKRVLKVERDFNHTREYWVTVEGQSEPVKAWNNSRLQVVTPNRSE